MMNKSRPGFFEITKGEIEKDKSNPRKWVARMLIDFSWRNEIKTASGEGSGSNAAIAGKRAIEDALNQIWCRVNQKVRENV